jgi:hypothetical protein
VQRTFKALSFVFIAVAFFFVWRQDLDAVFIAGVMAASCFFLSMRYEIVARRERREAERRSAENDH